MVGHYPKERGHDAMCTGAVETLAVPSLIFVGQVVNSWLSKSTQQQRELNFTQPSAKNRLFRFLRAAARVPPNLGSAKMAVVYIGLRVEAGKQVEPPAKLGCC